MEEKRDGLTFDPQALAARARSAASGLRAGKPHSLGRDADAVLRALHTLRRADSGAGRGEGAAAWLYDNLYLAQEAGKEAARELRSLGKAPEAEGEEVSAVFSLALGLAGAARGAVTPETIALYLRAYQRVRPLCERELAALLPALRGALVVLLARAREEEEGPEAEALFRRAFTSLRLLAETDLTELWESLSAAETILRRDPAGVYPRMDRETRALYRRELARLAKKEGLTEEACAKRVLRLSEEGPEKHVGHYLFTEPMGKRKRPRRPDAYVAALVVPSLFLAVLAGVLLESVWAAVLLLVPLSGIVKNAADYLAVRLTRPERLFRMDFTRGVPGAGRTLCVIAALLGSPADGEQLADLLEEYRLTNREAGENLLFGLLADLGESESETAEGDEAVLRAAAERVSALNARYGGGFFLLARRREKNEADGVYMPRERKRGALRELTRLLMGRESALRVLAGDREALRGVHYILTLDADTRLTAGAASELIGAALHPLNTPVMDLERGVVTAGYGILGVRVTPDLTAAGKSDFTRIVAGAPGLDPYGSVASDVYQDLFGEGTFTGKGLLNVPVYAALLDTAVPENALLSHDIVEGAYLRCGYVSDVELTDGCPWKVTSWFQRLDRWTRGDWQNIRYLGARVRNEAGAWVRNPLSDLNKWKIFDNLRRSLVPVFTFLALLFGMLVGTRAFLTVGAVAVLLTVSELVTASAAAALRRDGRATARVHSELLTGLAGTAARTLVRLLFLPAEAWTQARAIATALWRMLVTKKKLLAWVTASQAEKRRGNTLAVNYLRLWPCPAAGALALFFGRHPAFAVLGAVWLFAPAWAWALSRPRERRLTLSGADRAFLQKAAEDIWGYFRDHLTPEDHFLPPDNVQPEPAAGVAHRTSPTNIGLGLLSVLAAADLGLIGEAEAWERVGRTLDTLEELPKWRGHLYNWYDTRSLLPLEPRSVSSVDAGNLAACLVTLAGAAEEAGRAEERARVLALLRPMSFRPLFDAKRELFTISLDAAGKPEGGVYDLLSSEARLLSYVAVALGDVPRRHWRRLGRAQVTLGGYAGMASWTGTMFEYLMPELVLPSYPGSHLYETAKFALYAQKRAHRGLPWGLSESAYYAFSAGLVYRYKAHGAAALALKRGMESEKVIAPYASFLALPLDPAGAVRNLRRLAALGALGPYGFWEAVDFTPSRQTGGDHEPVRTFMAHHLGMSLVSIANTLQGGVMPRRFLRDPRMRAWTELLQERVPVGETRLTQPRREVPESPHRREEAGYGEARETVESLHPRSVPLSNGVYTVVFSENGKNRAETEGMAVSRWEEDPLGAGGVTFYFKSGPAVTPLLPAPWYRRDVKYAARLSGEGGQVLARWGSLSARTGVTVPASEKGERWTVDIAAAGRTPPQAHLVAAVEPVLAPRRDYDAHPAFQRLRLEARETEKGLLIRNRGTGLWLALCADGAGEWRTDGARGSFPESARFLPASPECRVSVRLPVRWENGRARVTLALAVGPDPEEAMAAAQRILRGADRAAIPRLGAAALMLGLDTAGVRGALDWLPELLFPAGRAAETALPKSALWRFGISGDLPLAALTVRREEDIPRMETAIRRHALLAENGVKADLALLLTDGGDYRSPQKRAAQELLAKLGREHTLEAPGGVHLLGGEEAERTVPALADLVLPPEEGAREETPALVPLPRAFPASGTAGAALAARFRQDGTFEAALRGRLTPLAWANILTNGRFGFAATEAGTGFLWAHNAHELRLTRWLGDAVTDRGPERLWLIRNGRRQSLFADGSDVPTLVRHGFGYTVWERDLGAVRASVTAFVPGDTDARVLLLRLEGAAPGDLIRWELDLALGGENRPRPTARAALLDGVPTAWDPAGAYPDLRFSALSGAAPLRWTGSRDEVLTGAYTGRPGYGAGAGLGLVYAAAPEMVLAAGTAAPEKMRALCDPAAARKSLREAERAWRERVTPVTAVTGRADLDRFLGGWALYETLAARLLGRTGLYQNGGAFGFRDQLQDAMALVPWERDPARRMLRLAARHQYEEGDVMHWWHPDPGGDKGVRTRIADDLVWLPWALADYVRRTGDRGLLREREPFVRSAPLGEEERDRYETPALTREKATMLEHAARAAKAFLRRGVGPHGLPWFLSGDWNDGMDRVGGESVWLAWFGSMALRGLGELYDREGDPEAAAYWQGEADRLKKAGEAAFRAGHYLRGYWADGSPLGGGEEGPCRIDSVAQSFAWFAGADPERCRAALMAAYHELYDPGTRLVRLFTPPFGDGPEEPGYVKAYAPGFRENGGQYTHAAVWLGLALLEAGLEEEGFQVLTAILPGGRDPETYRTEPYVLAADVSAAAGLEGRGGWTWYTGAAGWAFRALTEGLFGLRARDGRLTIEPRTPRSLPGAALTLRLGGRTLRVDIGPWPRRRVTVDGEEYDGRGIPLPDEKTAAPFPG